MKKTKFICIHNLRTRYFDYWFVIILQDPVSGLVNIPLLSAEFDFINKFSVSSSSLYSTLNGANFKVATNTKLRRFADSVQLQLQQSVLYEDISNLINSIASGIRARTNNVLGQRTVEYWGQNEYLSIDSLGQA